MKVVAVLFVLVAYAFRLLFFVIFGGAKLAFLGLQAFTRENLHGATILDPSFFDDMIPDAHPRQLVRAIQQIIERDDDIETARDR